MFLAQETIRLEILHQTQIPLFVLKVTSTKNEIFMLCAAVNRIVGLSVCNRNNTAELKEVNTTPVTHLLDVAGCSLSDCVHVLGFSKGILCSSVFRITKDEEQQLSISPWIDDVGMPSSISVSTNGNQMVLYRPRAPNPPSVSIYDSNACLQHRMLSPGIIGVEMWDNFIQKSNENLVLASLNQQEKKELIEIDATGSVIRKYKSSVSAHIGPYFADAHGRFVITEENDGIKLFVYEVNLAWISLVHRRMVTSCTTIARGMR